MVATKKSAASQEQGAAANSSYHHGNLRDALIAEGRAALKEIGVGELSLRRLAHAVGVSEAAPSRHFASKEEFLAAIAADGFGELSRIRHHVLSDSDQPMQRAFDMMKVYVDFARENPGVFNLMIGPRIVARDRYRDLSVEGAKSFRLFSGAVEAFAIDQGWSPDALPLVVHAAWSVEHGLATLILSDRIPRTEMPLPIDHVVESAITTLLCAIAAGEETFRNTAAALSKTTGSRLPRREPVGMS